MFVQAHSFTNANRGVGDIERVVVHTAEIEEGGQSAERIAAFFASAPAGVSAHAVIDTNTRGRVRQGGGHRLPRRRATTRRRSGTSSQPKAGQSAAEWKDAASTAMLQRFARYIAPRCVKYDIPVRWLTPEQERLRVRGFVTHKVVSATCSAKASAPTPASTSPTKSSWRWCGQRSAS